MRVELSLPQNFLDLLSATGGIFYGDIKNQLIKFICTDSRECTEGDAFFALDGKSFDGNDFITDAIKRGAIPIGRKVKRYGIRVDSGNQALLSFASFYKKALPHLIHTVAITGSVGKTTTKELLKKLSSTKYKTHANRENYNNEIGAAITVLSSPIDTEILILEFGMNHFGEIRQLSRAFAPDVAVITKIGTSHIGNLGSRENIAKAKLEITSGLEGVLILPFGESLLYGQYPRTIYFSSKSSQADIAVLKNYFGQPELYLDKSIFSFFDFPITADHILECLSAAISAAIEIGISPEKIIEGICNIESNIFRHRIIKSKRGYTILDDSYNASYESVRAALAMINDVPSVKQRHALLGDIMELGDKSYDIHRSLGMIIPDYGIHYLFLIGSYADAIHDGAINSQFDSSRIFILNDLKTPERISMFIGNMLRDDDLILVKGSHGMNLGKIVELLR